MIFAERRCAVLNTQFYKLQKTYQVKANVIDLGCMPDTKFDHLEEVIEALKSR